MWSDAHDGALLHILGVVGTRLRKAAGVCDTVLDKASRACRAGPSPTFETPVLCLGLVPRYSIRRSKKLSVQKRGRGKKQGCSMQLQHLQIRTQAKLQRRPPLQIHQKIGLVSRGVRMYCSHLLDAASVLNCRWLYYTQEDANGMYDIFGKLFPIGKGGEKVNRPPFRTSDRFVLNVLPEPRGSV